MLFQTFVQGILDDVARVFSDPSFEETAQEHAQAIETNRLALAAALRRIPGVVRLAQGAMLKGERPHMFLFLDAAQVADAPFDAGAHPSVEANDAYREALDLLLARAQMYARMAGAQRCALMLATDGTEAVDLSWAPEHDFGHMAPRYTTWSKQQVGGGLPHDFVGYLVGTGRLYQTWTQDTTEHPHITSTLNDGTMRVHTHVPQQAAALQAVQRWPVLFAYDPYELGENLSELVTAPF